MNIAYVRVSTVEQNPQRQREALRAYEIDRWYEDRASGKDANRPELKNMMGFVREGDTVYIHDLSRLARNTRDLLNIVEELNGKKVHLVSYKENIDSSTPTGKLMLTMIGAIAEFERQNILERQREGIAIAKKAGKYKGGKKKSVDEGTFLNLFSQYQARKLSKREMADRLNISRPTLDKLIKAHTDNGTDQGPEG